MSARYMLDTNIASHALRGHPEVLRRLISVPMASLCVSAITEGELRFGLAKRPEAVKLRAAVAAFLLRVDILPWDGTVAAPYGALRAALTQAGKTPGPLDMLIAAHAIAAGRVLVTNDATFATAADLRLEDWTRP